VVEVSEIIEASPSPEVSPSPEPTVPPEPAVTPPPPAPEWTMSFASDLLGKTSSFTLENSTVQGEVGKAVQYSQVVTGSLGGRRNRTFTRIYVEYWGSAKGDSGNAQFFFVLDTGAERYEYRANASLTSVTLAEDGSAVYAFTGWYARSTAPVVADVIMPHEGKINLNLDFWSDGSLYASSLEFVEVP
jgi:hypothetical protein